LSLAGQALLGRQRIGELATRLPVRAMTKQHGLKIRASVVRFRPRPPRLMRLGVRVGFWGVSTKTSSFLQSRLRVEFTDE